MTDQTKKSAFLAYLEEFGRRLISPSPLFFKIIQRIALLIALLAGAAEILLKANVTLPHAVALIANWTIIISSIIAFIVAKLPVVDKDQKVTSGQLAFTSKRVAEGVEPIH